jgi:hypothetical protein
MSSAGCSPRPCAARGRPRSRTSRRSSAARRCGAPRSAPRARQVVGRGHVAAGPELGAAPGHPPAHRHPVELLDAGRRAGPGSRRGRRARCGPRRGRWRTAARTAVFMPGAGPPPWTIASRSGGSPASTPRAGPDQGPHRLEGLGEAAAAQLPSPRRSASPSSSPATAWVFSTASISGEVTIRFSRMPMSLASSSRRCRAAARARPGSRSGWRGCGRTRSAHRRAGRGRGS